MCCIAGGGSGTMLAITAALLSLGITGLYAQTLQFTQQSYAVALNETSTSPANLVPRPPDGFLTVACTGGSLNITYAILSSDLLPFNVHTATGEFSVTEDLDYDTQTIPYIFSVVCYEGGNLTINNTAAIEITLQPVNEYRPELIESSAPFILVNETLPVGTVIVANSEDAPPGALKTYRVRDGDKGIDGLVTYTSSDINEVFLELDVARGFLTLIKELDLDSNEDPAPMVLRPDITACDFLPPISTCPNIDVNIFIISVNEFSPEFSQEIYTVAVAKNVTEAYTVLQTTCTDQDRGVGELDGVAFANGTSVTVMAIFSLDNDGSIGVPAMTFNTAVSYQFTLRCYDSGGLEDYADVTINIDDPLLNEYTPEFSQKTYSVTVPEDTDQGFTIIQAKCVDNDLGVGEFASIEYVDATPARGSDLELDTTTGDITVITLDYESVQSYKFMLQCSDTDGLVDIGNVSITVTDVNDHTPQCDNTTVTPTLKVGTYSNPTLLLSLSCYDFDSGKNAELSYEILQVSPPNDALGIYAMTGEVTFRGVLEGTGRESYTLTISVSDSGDPPLSQEVVITVRLDVTPSCAASNLETELSAGRYDSALVLTLSCQGHDDLTYSIVGSTIPSNLGRFDLDGSTGELTFTGAVDEGSYNVTVRVADPSGLSSNFLVTIEVGPAQSDESSDDELPIYVIVIPIVIILILFVILIIAIVVIIVMVIRRRREKFFQARVELTAAIMEHSRLADRASMGNLEEEEEGKGDERRYSERPVDIGDLETTDNQPREPATSNGVSTKRGEGKPGWQESGHRRPPSQMDLEIGSTSEIQLPTNSEKKELPPSEMDNIAEFDTTPM